MSILIPKQNRVELRKALKSAKPTMTKKAQAAEKAASKPLSIIEEKIFDYWVSLESTTKHKKNLKAKLMINFRSTVRKLLAGTFYDRFSELPDDFKHARFSVKDILYAMKQINLAFLRSGRPKPLSISSFFMNSQLYADYYLTASSENEKDKNLKYACPFLYYLIHEESDHPSKFLLTKSDLKHPVDMNFFDFNMNQLCQLSAVNGDAAKIEHLVVSVHNKIVIRWDSGNRRNVESFIYRDVSHCRSFSHALQHIISYRGKKAVLATTAPYFYDNWIPTELRRNNIPYKLQSDPVAYFNEQSGIPVDDIRSISMFVG